MHRIDASGYAAGGFFKSSPAPATVVSVAWLNGVQEEIAKVIEDPTGGNTALVKANNGQLLTAIRKIAIPAAPTLAMPGRSFNPDGTIEMWASASCAANTSTAINLLSPGFPTACLFALCNGGNPSGSQQDNPPFVTAWSTTQVTVYNAIDSAVTVNVWAKGY